MSETERRARLADAARPPFIWPQLRLSPRLIQAVEPSWTLVAEAELCAKCSARSSHTTLGLDLIRYDGFATDGEVLTSNLDDTLPLVDEYADVVASIETIEQVENPRVITAHAPSQTGGVVIVSTPNQQSMLSKMTLVLPCTPT